MPKQKYYYAVWVKNTDSPLLVNGGPILEGDEQWLKFKYASDSYAIVPIPADSLHKLILSHTNKKAK